VEIVQQQAACFYMAFQFLQLEMDEAQRLQSARLLCFRGSFDVAVNLLLTSSRVSESSPKYSWVFSTLSKGVAR